jgi:hypothetical protein
MDVYVHQVVSVSVKHHRIESENPFWVTHLIINEEGVKAPHVIKLFSEGDKIIIQEETKHWRVSVLARVPVSAQGQHE